MRFKQKYISQITNQNFNCNGNATHACDGKNM